MMCSGRTDERLILKAFTAGADDILVCGCHPWDCHYQKGSLNARRRVTGWRPLLDMVGIGKERLRLEWLSASREPKLTETVETFAQTIKGLGSGPFNRR